MASLQEPTSVLIEYCLGFVKQRVKFSLQEEHPVRRLWLPMKLLF